MPSVFDPSYQDLPAEIPIFPLSRVLLLPGSRLPLNIFEPRYLNMTDTALAGERLIGMIQPVGANTDPEPELYKTGCVGRIVSFSETEDGRYLITLGGLIRFDIAEERPLRDGFRVAGVDWTPYRHDMESDTVEGIDRERVLGTLRSYFSMNKVDANWKAIEETTTSRLVNSLSMMIPFQSSEKQALLEASTLMDRCEILVTLLEMALAGNDDYDRQKRN